jgi:hypothetical protein
VDSFDYQVRAPPLLHCTQEVDMSRKLSIYRGRVRYWLCGNTIRTHRRRNPSFKIGPRHSSKTSIRARKQFFDSYRITKEK